MRIQFRRSGGVAGMTFATTVETDSLAPQDAEHVARLVDDAGFFDLPARLPSRPGTADECEYEITVETEGRTHAVVTRDTGAPASLIPLLDWLNRAARRSSRPPP
jgi:hypothetical protein